MVWYGVAGYGVMWLRVVASRWGGDDGWTWPGGGVEVAPTGLCEHGVVVASQTERREGWQEDVCVCRCVCVDVCVCGACELVGRSGVCPSCDAVNGEG